MVPSLVLEEKEGHIFFLELMAAIEGLYTWRNERGAIPVILVLDNSAVAFALRNGFSGNNRAMALLRKHHEVLSLVQDVVLVISEDNPADTSSRKNFNREDELKRLGRVRACFGAYEREWNWASKKHDFWRAEAGIMHQPEPSDEEAACTFNLDILESCEMPSVVA